MGHNVGAKAESAVEKSKKVKASERTPEQIIADIRRNFAAGLAVPPDDQKFLLGEYERVHLTLAEAIATNTTLKQALESIRTENLELTAKVEEFRAVYEQENRRTTLQVDTFSEVRGALAEPASSADNIFDEACLDEITAFLKSETDKWKASLG